MDNLLTKDEAYAIAEHIDKSLYEMIRNDLDIDSLQWLRNMIHGYEKLCVYSGYVGLTESKLTADGWISVEDRLPTDIERCLVYVPVRYAHTGSWTFYETRTALYHVLKERFYVDERDTEGEKIGRVTHWRPLPEPPKEEENE